MEPGEGVGAGAGGVLSGGGGRARQGAGATGQGWSQAECHVEELALPTHAIQLSGKVLSTQ